MYRRLFAAAVMVALTSAPALAALSVGASAPDFNAQASMGGKVFNFSLADALKKGPVVLYFYPAAFTKGCTIEAHTFAAAMDQFKALHATVIGVSHDNIDTLNKFSVSECRSKFPVAADPSLTVAKQYDAVLPQAPTYANRTSYVIAPDGKILATLTDLSHPQQHVTNALAVLKQYESSQKSSQR
ncbi:MAG TPA: peroxiredoxin [Candidatus Baltobacteraceae bacterium]|nr:peroxiredoxin [Candidatus Baltobacteraceae bacterium]